MKPLTKKRIIGFALLLALIAILYPLHNQVENKFLLASAVVLAIYVGGYAYEVSLYEKQSKRFLP